MQPILCHEMEPEHDAEWDAFVRSSPQGNAFLLSACLNLLAANENPRALARRVAVRTGEGGPIAAGWAVLVRRRWVFRYCSSFPLFYAGPMLAPEFSQPAAATHRATLLDALAREMQNGLDFLDTEAAPELVDTRGLGFADCACEKIYTHVWPACEADTVPGLLNRSKRREMKAAEKRHVFGWRAMSADRLDEFDRLHNLTIEKFKWVAPARWRAMLLADMAGLEKTGICRLFVAAPADSPDRACAMVSVLFSPDHQTAWLWRVAYQTDDPGLIPALYVHAAQAVKREHGPDWKINFGGSPRLSLSLFKDHLGALPTPHCRILWQRPGWKPLLWNSASLTKEILRQRLTLAGWR